MVYENRELFLVIFKADVFLPCVNPNSELLTPRILCMSVPQMQSMHINTGWSLILKLEQNPQFLSNENEVYKRI